MLPRIRVLSLLLLLKITILCPAFFVRLSRLPGGAVSPFFHGLNEKLFIGGTKDLIIPATLLGRDPFYL
jgi:hypothetical protein